MAEGRGTCATKHALLARLATEQGIDAALTLGIYEMSERIREECIAALSTSPP